MLKTRMCSAVFTVLLLFMSRLAFAADYGVIDHTALKALIDSNEHRYLLVDARNPEEYRDSHIPGAINIPQKAMADYLGLLPSDKSMALIFYCNGIKCGKSKKAAVRAIELGYSNVQVFTEGMPVWEEVGYSFYKSGDYEKPIETQKINPVDLKNLRESEPERIQIVDVRDPAEFAEGHIPGAINCPLKDFALRSEVLHKDKKVVVYCNGGGRSYKAYRKLQKLGYKDIAQALFADWQEAGLPVAL